MPSALPLSSVLQKSTPQSPPPMPLPAHTATNSTASSVALRYRLPPLCYSQYYAINRAFRLVLSSGPIHAGPHEPLPPSGGRWHAVLHKTLLLAARSLAPS